MSRQGLNQRAARNRLTFKRSTMLSAKGLVGLVVALIVVYISYSVYQEPVPASTSNPLRLKWASWVFGFLGTVGKTLQKLGITNESTVAKFGRDYWNIISLSFTSVKGVLIEDTMFDDVPVRLYRPEGSTGVLPGMVYYHGGGWVFGSYYSHEQPIAYFTREVEMVVAFVTYRLRPEFSQMDGLQDCLVATKHFLKDAEKFNVDPDRIAIGGDSAGGNFASVISMLLRDEKFHPMPKSQLIIYPVTQAIDLNLPSYQQNSGGPGMSRDDMLWFLSYVYFSNSSQMASLDRNIHVPRSVREEMGKTLLNHDLLPKELLYPPYKKPKIEDGDAELWNQVKDKVLDWHHYPLMAKDLSSLPEAYIFTAQYDVLRDEGILYAQRLKEAGIKVTHYNCPFCWHGMIKSVDNIKDAQIAMNHMVSYLKETL